MICGLGEEDYFTFYILLGRGVHGRDIYDSPLEDPRYFFFSPSLDYSRGSRKDELPFPHPSPGPVQKKKGLLVYLIPSPVFLSFSSLSFLFFIPAAFIFCFYLFLSFLNCFSFLFSFLSVGAAGTGTGRK